MASVQLTPTTLAVRLTRFEKIAGLLPDVELPRSAVVGAEVVAEPLRHLPGMRAPGYGLPRVRAIGTWRRCGQRTLVCVRGPRRRSWSGSRTSATTRSWSGTTARPSSPGP